jgi:hypothetical protein
VSTNGKLQGIDLPTLIAISIVAWASVNILHEIVGHAGASLLVGVPVNAVSTTTIYMVADWDQFVAERGLNPIRLIVAAGSIMNLVTGGLALLALQWKRITSVTTRYFLWLFAAFSMIILVGNMITNSLLGIGDVSEFLSGLEPVAVWKVVVIGSGLLLVVAGYVFSLGLKLPKAKGQRLPLLAMTALPVVTLIVVQTLSLVRSPFATLPPETNHLLASVFAYIHFILWALVVNLIPGPHTKDPSETVLLPRSNGWLTLGVVAFVIFVLVIGPGIGSFAGDPRLGVVTR